MKVHTMLVIGQRDLDAQNISVRVHGKSNLRAEPRAEVVADILSAIKERRERTADHMLDDVGEEARLQVDACSFLGGLTH